MIRKLVTTPSSSSRLLVPIVALSRRRIHSFSEDEKKALGLIERTAEDIYRRSVIPFDHYGLVPKERASLPMVLLLGNHSSGKSSFINYLLNQKEQATGVAPTDDGFTVITRGESHSDQDGQSLMSDTRYAFGDLRQFGPSFLNHFKLKVRTLPADAVLPYNMMVVDSPGMIDTPLRQEQGQRDNRGYDFLKVVRWFAERSDLILLLFDPNNPGTTGETLDVLTESLVDLDHKFLLILNKVDQFAQVHDFARAYGSLCWNLAKVIRRKDIPRIYTMFTPTQFSSRGQASPDLPSSAQSLPVLSAADVHLEELKKTEGKTVARGIPLLDFNRTRDEVVSSIILAPRRRVDNIVTQLEESIMKVQIAAVVSNAVRAGSRRRSAFYYSCSFGSAVVGPVVLGSCLYLGLPSSVVFASCVGTLGALGGLTWTAQKSMKNYQSSIQQNIDSVFRSIYFKQYSDDLDLQRRWEVIKPKLCKAFATMDLGQIPKVKPSALKQMQRILETDVMKLRKECDALRITQVDVGKITEEASKE
eukprot:NODE_966_length_1789_cov_26.352874_g852_i0.p1 GENE.NODE_966_length_1789_cov_26.352874_g852_i0~~NODE_966_length_1789_cov_26.352874_g852_i0.p1  ORF type:complete len:531 (+),score=98.53 NODE_966_length_1789_cov_26.352874_g852_i0:70-1662(+)